MARDYVQLFRQLLPPGKAWERSYTSTAQSLYVALMAEFARIDARVQDLLLEMDPRTVTETIDDWERAWGLPDLCVTTPPTLLAERRLALTSRVISRGGWSGGPSVPFFGALIEALGVTEYVIRRFHFQPFTCDSLCDDPLNGGPMIYIWEFVILHSTPTIDEVAVCQISKYLEAQIGLSYAFPLVLFTSGVFVRGSSAVFTDPITGNEIDLGTDELGTIYVGPG